MEQIFGPCRSHATRKPRQSNEDPNFHRCPQCGRILYSFGNSCGASSFQCCGVEMDPLVPQNKASLPAYFELDYKIIGGPNNNAIQVLWSSPNSHQKPAWIFLKNYTGGQFKLIPDEKKSPAVFPLADEDAYVYCSEDPCLECVFCCKWGFSFFVFFEQYGLIALPIDRKRANWQSPPTPNSL